jgi:hypothetical protein
MSLCHVISRHKAASPQNIGQGYYPTGKELPAIRLVSQLGTEKGQVIMSPKESISQLINYRTITH